MRAYRVGAMLLVATGAIHCAAHVGLVLGVLRNPEKARLVEAMRGEGFRFLGVTRTLVDSLQGFSLSVAAFGVFTGLALLANPAPSRAAKIVGLAAALTGTAVAAAYFPLPPIALFAAATVSFALALRASR